MITYYTKRIRKRKVQFLTLAAPVLLGMMLKLAALQPLQSLTEGTSTVFWVATRIHTCHSKDYKHIAKHVFHLTYFVKLTVMA
jgi:hypothetical protein